jgi:isochorismate pyruvate lyase
LVKPPESCLNLEEIRAEIDGLDRELLSLLKHRFGYVRAAAKFKTTPESVAAPERFRTMLEARRRWAEEDGLDQP